VPPFLLQETWSLFSRPTANYVWTSTQFQWANTEKIVWKWINSMSLNYRKQFGLAAKLSRHVGYIPWNKSNWPSINLSHFALCPCIRACMFCVTTLLAIRLFLYVSVVIICWRRNKTATTMTTTTTVGRWRIFGVTSLPLPLLPVAQWTYRQFCHRPVSDHY